MPTWRVTPILTLCSGLLLIVVPLLVEFVAGEFFLLLGVALLLLVFALPGLHRLQRGADGRLGRWGVRLTICGLVVVAALVLVGELLLGSAESDVAEAVLSVLAALSMLAAVAGLVMFAIGITRSSVYPSAGMWLFLGGMVVALVSESFEQSLQGPVPTLADILPPAGFIVAGLGLVALGLSARSHALTRRSA